jgi:hypothetical protein
MRIMTSSASSPLLLFLSGQTMAQLRELARSTGLSSVYSRLSRYQLIEALQQVLPEPQPADSQGTALPAVEAAPSSQSAAAPAGHPQAPSGEEASAAVTQVTFLPRDPRWAYVYWQLSSADRQRAAAAGAQQLCLRVADVTGLPPGASHPHALQEVVLEASASEWYLPVPLSDRDYRVELGFRLAAGGWLSLAHSAIARIPADGPSDLIADRYVPFSLEASPSDLGVLSGGPTQGGVQHELMYQRSVATNPLRQRLGSEVWHEGGEALTDQELGQSHASGAGLWASGLSESGSGLLRNRSFWLVADAELIVYGATEPSASLFIGDQQVPLAADGTFRVHVPFRDGEQLYPIRAVAADGEQERWIELDFKRQTPQARVNSREAATIEWF